MTAGWRAGVLLRSAAGLLAVTIPLTAAGVTGDAGERSESDDSGSPAARVRSIREQIERDRWREALEAARAAVRRHGADAEVLTALGEAEFRAGEIEAATSTLEGVVEAHASPPVRALTVLGLIRAAQGRAEACRRLMTRALSRAPDDPYVLYRAAGIQSTRAEAIEVLERYLEAGEEEHPDRVEGVRGTLMLYRALGERPVWVPESRPARVEVPLRPLSGLVGYAVEAKLGTARDKPVRLLLDTGSAGLHVLERTARKHGFEALAEETMFGGGGSGRHRSDRGLFDLFSLGQLRFGDALASTTRSGLDTTSGYRGVVGIGPFEGYRVVLDLRRRRLILDTPPERPEPGGAPYWVVAGQILIRAHADTGPSGLFLLDTGATRTLLDRSFAERITAADLGGRTRVYGYGGVRQDARRVEGAVIRFQAVASDGGAMNAVDLSLRSRLCGVEVSGFLGLDVLRDARIVIDTHHRRIRVDRP